MTYNNLHKNVLYVALGISNKTWEPKEFSGSNESSVWLSNDL